MLRGLEVGPDLDCNVAVARPASLSIGYTTRLFSQAITIEYRTITSFPDWYSGFIGIELLIVSISKHKIFVIALVIVFIVVYFKRFI